MSISNTFQLGFKPGFAAQHSNGELWVSDATNGKIVVYKFENSLWTIKNSLLTGADPHAIAFNLNGTKAYVTNQGSGMVSEINTATFKKIKDIPVGSKPNGIALKE
jgi:YVTN family beta-propeller protein